jgi:TolB-like protein
MPTLYLWKRGSMLKNWGNLNLFYALIICLLISPPLYSQENSQQKKPTVAVITFSAHGLSEMAAVSLTEILRNNLVQSKKLNVIEQSQMDKVLSLQAFQQTGCTDAECAVEIGKILNVEKVVLGSVSKIGRKYIVSLRLVDVELGKIETAVTSTRICGLEELTEVVEEAGNKLLEEMIGKKKIEKEQFGSIEITSNPYGVEVFIDGILKGKTPILIGKLKEGSYEVVVKAKGYKEWKKSISVKEDQTTKIFANLEKISLPTKKPKVKPPRKERNLALGFSNPCVSVKFWLGNLISIEGRYAFSKDIVAPSGRIYLNFTPKSRTVLYIGGEYGVIDFEYKDTKGKGKFLYGFAGFEYFLTKWFAFNIDFGQARIIFNEYGGDVLHDISASELVYNLGINIYFK